MNLALALLIAALPAVAQEADAGVADGGQAAADGGIDPNLERELQQALKADQKPTAAPSAPESATQPAPTPALPRGAQSLNPDISAILDADFGYVRRMPQFMSGDDPDFKPDSTQHALGPAVQEVELALSAVVDPYFKGEVYLTIPNLNGIEVEEAFATTTSLPWNLQARMGSFRSAFGRQNGQHLHVQDFTRRPLINAAFLGPDGLRGPAAQVSWLAPLPFFLTLYGEVFGLTRDPAQAGELITNTVSDPISTFGAEGGKRPTLLAEAKVFIPASEEWSVYGGLNFASGESPGLSVGRPDGTTVPLGFARSSQLYGADLYVKWKPPNVSGGYTSLALQAEAILRHFDAGGSLPAEWDGGAYAQAVLQFARRWFVGVRGDFVGLPASSVLARTSRLSTSLTFQASEFARVRGYVELEHGNITLGDESMPAGALLPAVRPSYNPAAILQLEISIGAHGAHPF